LIEGLEEILMVGGGLNEEIMGSDDKDISGMLSKVRTGAALTGLQGLFSGFRGSKRQVGIKLVRLNQLLLPPAKVMRMIGDSPAPGFYDLDFTQYDCTPTEGVLTDNQKHSNFMMLDAIRSKYPDAAAVIPISVLLKMSPIQPTKEFLQMLEQAEQQAKAQAQSQQQQQDRINKLVEAQTAAQVARAREDVSDVAENRANIALKNAQTLVQTQKLMGENSRAPGVEYRETVLAIMDRMLEAQKIADQRKTVASKQK